MPHLIQAAPAGFGHSRSDVTHRARQAARQLFQRAYTLGWLGKLRLTLTRQSPYLLNLAEVEANDGVGNRYSAGRQEVPIRQIQGSQGRCLDFDRNFYPLKEHLKSRWLRVAMARQLGIALPPVELIKMGEIYFVRDGHHRISVARTLGQTEIEAEVRVWDLKN
ncbi:MAG TPA: hypothetical protein VGD99_09905 [Anaerolineae bacterium]|jgi:hypothetical protein